MSKQLAKIVCWAHRDSNVNYWLYLICSYCWIYKARGVSDSSKLASFRLKLFKKSERVYSSMFGVMVNEHEHEHEPEHKYKL